MCYSQRTSLIAYSLAMASACFALYTKQYVIGILILFFCQMQLSEFLIWKGIDNNDKKLNKIGTAIGKYTLPSHNIAIALGILLLVYMSNQPIKPIYYLPLIIGILFYIAVLYLYSRENSKLETYPLGSCDKDCQNSQNRLVWPYDCTWYILGFFISLSLFFFYYKLEGLDSQIFLSLFFITTACISILSFNSNVAGSIWCFLAAILSPLIVLGNYYIMNKTK